MSRARNRNAGRDRRIEEIIRELPAVAADPAFRERLRLEFIAGSLRSSARFVETVRTSPFTARWRAWTERGWGVASPLRWAAATVLLIALLAAGVVLNRGEAWRLHSVTSDGTVYLNGSPIPAGRLQETPHALRAGREIRLEGAAQLELVLDGTLLMQITPGSAATMPGRAGRWFGRTLRMDVLAGEVRYSTGPRFLGCRLRIEGVAAEAEVLGTTLAVLSGPDSTCVCVLDGEVRMRAVDGQEETVTAGTRRIVYRGLRSPLVEPISPMETMKLSMLRDAATRIVLPPR